MKNGVLQRLCACVLCLAILITFLTACGSSGSTSSSKEDKWLQENKKTLQDMKDYEKKYGK